MKKLKSLITTTVFLCMLSSYASDAENIKFFQMGHEKTPFMKDAIPVTQHTLYNSKTGYGWQHKGSRGDESQNLVARMLKPGTPPVPDSISGYCVFWRGGKEPLVFKVDVPDGEYKIWVYSGMFCYNRIYDITPFVISAGTTDKTGNSENLKHFKERFYEGLDDSYEYTPKWTTETIWEKYIKNQSITVYSLTGKAVNGQLNINFEMPQVAENEQIRTIRSILPINAILICPVSELETGKKKFEEIAKARHDEYVGHIKLFKAAGHEQFREFSAEFQETGYVPFVRDFMKTVYAESIPEKSEITKDLSIFMTEGQREIASFAVHPLKDMKNVKIEISPLKDEKGNTLPENSVKLQWIRYMIQPVDYQHRTAEYLGVPLLMMDYKMLDYMKGMNRQYILAVTTPENVVPGTYKGSVSIIPEEGKTTALNLEVKVYPFKLETYPDDDERIWLYYGDASYKSYGPLLMTEDERWQLLDKNLAFMKQQLISTTILFDYFAPDEELDQFMALYQKYNFRGYAVFGDYKMLTILEKYTKGQSKNRDISPFISKIKDVIKRGKKKNWPKMAFYTFAEIHTGMPGYELGKEMIDEIKKAIPEAILLELPNMVDEAEVTLESKVDILGPNAVSMTKDVIEKTHKTGKKLWFYGWGRQRFRSGMVDWRMGNRGAIKEWYSCPVGAHFNPLDAAHFDCWNDAPPFIGPNGPISTPGMEETTEGRLDFFYLATLDQWLEKMKSEKTPLAQKAAAYGQSIIDDLKGRIAPEYAYYYHRLKKTDIKTNRFGVNLEEVFKWKNEEYDIYRKKIANAIVAMQDALKGIDSVPVEEKVLSADKSLKKSAKFTSGADGAFCLSDNEFANSMPSYSPDGKSISYIFLKDDKRRIVIVDPENKKENILPPSIDENTSYNWSPSCGQIAYTSAKKIFVIDIKDNKITKAGNGKDPVFSPDGKKLAYLTRKDVMLFDLATGKLSNLTRQKSESSMEKLAWTPDGNSIYYSKDGSLWTVMANGKDNKCILARESLKFQVPPAIESPAVTPDGKKVFVTLDSDGLFAHVSNNQIGVLDLESGKFEIIADANSWDLSRDGKALAYSVGGELIILDLASGKKSVFASGENPAFSPDGNTIAYLFRESMLQEPSVMIKKIK